MYTWLFLLHVILALLNLQNILPNLEFVQTQLCLKKEHVIWGIEIHPVFKGRK